MRRIALLLGMVLMALAPAAAHAAPTWNRVADPAPGTTLEFGVFPKFDFTVAEATPYLASETTTLTWGDPKLEHLTVWRPNQAGTKWIQVGPRLDDVALRNTPRDPGARDVFAIAAGGSTPWVTWTEGTQDGKAQVHVAKLDGSQFVEPASGWPVVDSTPAQIRIVVFEGRPYVTVRGDVMRTTAGGDAVEHVTTGLPTGCNPAPVVSSGELYTACDDELYRLNASRSAWVLAYTHSEPFTLVDVTGTLYLLGQDIYSWSDDAGAARESFAPAPVGSKTFAGFEGTLYAAIYGDMPAPDVVGPTRVRALVGGAWFEAPSPSQAYEGGLDPKIVEGPDGNLWLGWHASNHNGFGEPRYVHVARFAEQGAPFTFAPDPAGSSQGEDPPPATTCAHEVLGTAGPDRLVGTPLSDRIVGRAGADTLLGRAGADCLSGGRGRDRIRAGAGRDRVSGGRGGDTIFAVRGGIDRVDCGPADDTAHVSRNDVAARCEHVVFGRRR